MGTLNSRTRCPPRIHLFGLSTDSNRIRESEASLIKGLSDNHAVNTAMAQSPEPFQIFERCDPARGRDLQTGRFRDQAGLIGVYAGEHTGARDVCVNDSLDSG